MPRARVGSAGPSRAAQLKSPKAARVDDDAPAKPAARKAAPSSDEAPAVFTNIKLDPTPMLSMFAPLLGCIMVGLYDRQVTPLLVPHMPGDSPAQKEAAANFVLEYCLLLPAILLGFVNLLMQLDDTMYAYLRALYKQLDIRTPFGRLLTDILTVSNACWLGALSIGAMLVYMRLRPGNAQVQSAAATIASQYAALVDYACGTLEAYGLPRWVRGLLTSESQASAFLLSSFRNSIPDPRDLAPMLGQALFHPLKDLLSLPLLAALRPEVFPSEKEVGVFFLGITAVLFSSLFLFSGPQWVKRFVMLMGALTCVRSFRACGRVMLIIALL